MPDLQPTAFIVDDDEAILDALRLLLGMESIRVKTFTRARAFLDHYTPEQPGCLLLDIHIPGMTGLELQASLREIGAVLPIIFITGAGTIPMAVEAMKAGAYEFVEKPFDAERLTGCIRGALRRDAENREIIRQKQIIKDCIAKLTPREKQVMAAVVAGKANKVIADELGVSTRTVEIHRSHVMLKMQTKSAAKLATMIEFAE